MTICQGSRAHTLVLHNNPLHVIVKQFSKESESHPQTNAKTPNLERKSKSTNGGRHKPEAFGKISVTSIEQDELSC